MNEHPFLSFHINNLALQLKLKEGDVLINQSSMSIFGDGVVEAGRLALSNSQILSFPSVPASFLAKEFIGESTNFNGKHQICSDYTILGNNRLMLNYFQTEVPLCKFSVDIDSDSQRTGPVSLNFHGSSNLTISCRINECCFSGAVSISCGGKLTGTKSVSQRKGTSEVVLSGRGVN